MFCKKCGTQVPDDARCCPNCGANLVFGEQFRESANNMFHSAEQELGSAINDVNQTFNGGRPPYSGERLKEDRGIGIYILLSIITCGIYSYYFLYSIAHDVNIACEGDGDSTSGLVAFILLSMITCGIYSWFWYYNLGNRLASNAPRYGLNFQENGTTILLWMILGSALCGLGPFIAMHILIKNSNKICAAYNRTHGL